MILHNIYVYNAYDHLVNRRLRLEIVTYVHKSHEKNDGYCVQKKIAENREAHTTIQTRVVCWNKKMISRTNLDKRKVSNASEGVQEAFDICAATGRLAIHKKVSKTHVNKPFNE